MLATAPAKPRLLTDIERVITGVTAECNHARELRGPRSAIKRDVDTGPIEASIRKALRLLLDKLPDGEAREFALRADSFVRNLPYYPPSTAVRRLATLRKIQDAAEQELDRIRDQEETDREPTHQQQMEELL